MKPRTVILSVLALFLMVSAISAAPSVISATSPQDAAALVYVSGYDLDPRIFYPYETGTITVHVTNGANASVAVSQPDLIDPRLHVVNGNPFSTMTNIGPGATVDFVFLVTVDPPDGTLFPLFTVSPKVYGNAIHSTLKVAVDSTDIRASIAKKPDTFSISKKDTVNVSVVNPRNGNLSNILIIPETDGAAVSPAEFYVGTLDAGSSAQVPFSVTPERATNVTFHVRYSNGDNKHSAEVVLPLVLAEDKTAAVPVINNVAVTGSGNSYRLTGDVTDAGIADAKAMVLTVSPPARGVEPYAEYAIGSLASDDFSSFELTFVTDNLSAVPVRISWKDTDGNSFSTVKTLDLRSFSGSGTGTGSAGSSGTGSGTSFGSSASGTSSSSSRTSGGPPGGGGLFGFGGSRGGGFSAFYLPIGLGILVIAAAVLWMKRKWIAAKLKKR
jgi:hypothetical protein